MRADGSGCNVVVSVALLCTLMFLPGCGGSGSGKLGGSTAPTAPSFTMTANTPKVNLAAGGSPVTVSFAINGSTGFASTVQIAATGVPDGVTVSSVSVSGAPNATATVTVTPGSSVAPGTYTLTFTATDSAQQTQSVTVTLTVAAAAPSPQLLHEHHRAVSTRAGGHHHGYLDGHL